MEYSQDELFSRRTCVRFVGSAERTPEVCLCGRNKDDHEPSSSNLGRHVSHCNEHEWCHAADTAQHPNPADGKIKFLGQGNTAPYVRVSFDKCTSSGDGHKPEWKDNDLLEKLHTKLFTEWKLEPPQVILSVTGGASKLQLNQQLEVQLKQMLIKMMKLTNVLIVTGGSNSGVMEYVGQAAREFKETISTGVMQDPVLGIATWGKVHLREELQEAIYHPQSAQYSLVYDGKQKMSDMVCLGSGHTHFIFVDDGTDNQPSKEIELRAALEDYISRNPPGKKASTAYSGKTAGKQKSRAIPLILLVIEGGPDTLKTVCRNAEQRVPILAVKGTGRAADCIIECCSISSLDQQVPLEAQFEELAKKYSLNCANDLREIYHQRELITSLDLEKEDDTDKLLLQAWVKAKLNASKSHDRPKQIQAQIERDEFHGNVMLIQPHTSHDLGGQPAREPHAHPEDTESVGDDSEDDVEHNIDLQSDKSWMQLGKKVNVWSDSLMYAMVLDQIPVLKVLVESHSHMFLISDDGRLPSGFMTKHWLELLYKYSAPHVITLCRTFKKQSDESDLPSVGKLLSKLTKKEIPTCYRNKNPDEVDKILRRNSVKHLLIWALLNNRRALARFFWHLGEDNLGAALVASAICSSLSKRNEFPNDIKLSYEKMSKNYGRLAVIIVDKAMRADPEKAFELLDRPLDQWGNKSPMELGGTFHVGEFMIHSCRAAHTEISLRRNLHLDTKLWKIFLSIIMPFLIYFMIDFQLIEIKHPEECNADTEQTTVDTEELDAVLINSSRGRTRPSPRYHGRKNSIDECVESREVFNAS